VVLILAQAQSEAGHDVGVAFLVPDNEPPGSQDNLHRFPLHRGNLLWAQESSKYPSPLRILNKIYTVFNFRSAREFGRAIDGFKPDVVHTHSLVELSPLVWKEVADRRIPLVHTLHDYDLLCVRASLFKGDRPCVVRHAGCTIISRWKELFHGRVNTVVAVSKAVLNIHLDFGLFRSLSPIHRKVIWNPVAPNDRGRKNPRHREENSDLTFGFMGRLVPEKGLDVLIGACRLLPRTGWRLRIAGRGPEGSDRYRKMAEGLPIEFVGFVDPNEFLAGIDVLVVPSIWQEPFGLNVIEAYAAGSAVIGAASGAITEIVGQVDQKCLVPPNDAVALAGRMMAAIVNNDEIKPDPAAVLRLLEKVDPDRISKAYIETYEEAIRSVKGSKSVRR
jgi:glycogen synthase